MINMYGGTDVGLVRKSNQDRFHCGVLSESLAYAVLCDGMGGPNGGNVASDIAVRHVAQALERELREELGENTLRGIMMSAAAGANALVHDAAASDESLKGMGTTLIIAVFSGEQMFVAYVGDSRVYTVRGEQETQLTRDHTVVQMLVELGEISEQDAQSHPKRHYITRAVGVSPSVDVDFLEQPFLAGDLALLCSDGLYHYLQPGELGGLLRESVARGNVDNLIELAKAGGGSDNITAIVAMRATPGREEADG